MLIDLRKHNRHKTISNISFISLFLNVLGVHRLDISPNIDKNSWIGDGKDPLADRVLFYSLRRSTSFIIRQPHVCRVLEELS